MKSYLALGLSAVVLGSYVLTTVLAQTPQSNEVLGASTGHARFESARTTILQGRMNKNKRQALTELFDEVAAAVEQLEGKKPWLRKDKNVPWQELERLLYQVAEEANVDSVAALFLDSKQEDAVRQLAMRTLLRYKNYTSEHLPLLSQVLAFTEKHETELLAPNRFWQSQRDYRIALAKLIGDILDVDVRAHRDNDNRPTVSTWAAFKPKQWLNTVLRHASTLEHNQRNIKVRRAIDHALAELQ